MPKRTYRWSCRGTVVIKVEVNGEVAMVTRYLKTDMVDPVDRERAADWLRIALPNADHETRYVLLWVEE
jgi:hypothetical protein